MVRILTLTDGCVRLLLKLWDGFKCPEATVGTSNFKVAFKQIKLRVMEKGQLTDCEHGENTVLKLYERNDSAQKVTQIVQLEFPRRAAAIVERTKSRRKRAAILDSNSPVVGDSFACTLQTSVEVASWPNSKSRDDEVVFILGRVQ